jgi:hypothetical protein
MNPVHHNVVHDGIEHLQEKYNWPESSSRYES